MIVTRHGMNPDDHISRANGYGRIEFPRARHGRIYAWRMGCRCEECVAARTEVGRRTRRNQQARGLPPAVVWGHVKRNADKRW